MGILYHSITGDVIAVFENGKVYKDVWKTQLIGSYKDEKIYAGKGFSKKYIGKFVNDLYIMRKIFDYTVVGNVRGNKVYCGLTITNSTETCYYDGDENGAAAAALITGMLSVSKKIQYQLV